MAIIIVTNPTPRNCDNDSEQRHCSLGSASVSVTVTRTAASASPRAAGGGGSSSKVCPFLWRCGSASTVSSSVVRHVVVDYFDAVRSSGTVRYRFVYPTARPHLLVRIHR
jgi:hypothetical protein